MSVETPGLSRLFPGPSMDLACVDGYCAPLADGFVHLGGAAWPAERGELLEMEGGLRDSWRSPFLMSFLRV